MNRENNYTILTAKYAVYSILMSFYFILPALSILHDAIAIFVRNITINESQIYISKKLNVTLLRAIEIFNLIVQNKFDGIEELKNNKYDIIRHINNNNFYTNVLTYLLLFISIFLILIVNGWNNVKSSILTSISNSNNDLLKKIDNIIDINGYKLFLGKKTFSYSFIRKKLILSPFTFSNIDKPIGKFILFHEKMHLIARDSIAKNFLINFANLSLVFLYIFTIGGLLQNILLYEISKSSIASEYLIRIGLTVNNRGMLLQELLTTTLPAFLLLIVVVYLANKCFKSFSYFKEITADNFASNFFNEQEKFEITNELNFKENNYHPDPSIRKHNINYSNSFSVGVIHLYFFYFCSKLFNVYFSLGGIFGDLNYWMGCVAIWIDIIFINALKFSRKDTLTILTGYITLIILVETMNFYRGFYFMFQNPIEYIYISIFLITILTKYKIQNTNQA